MMLNLRCGKSHFNLNFGSCLSVLFTCAESNANVLSCSKVVSSLNSLNGEGGQKLPISDTSDNPQKKMEMDPNKVSCSFV